VEVQE